MHEFERGILLREPAWHRLGNVVPEWPAGGWPVARAQVLPWEVELHQLETPGIVGGRLTRYGVPGYQLLARNDKALLDPSSELWMLNPEAVLSVQPTSYQVIYNAEFGNVIETIVGTIGEAFSYETLLCLSGGRLIVALLRARTPLAIACDPSLTHTYLGLTIRHDGQGGLRVVPTNVRIVCWNTHNAAEQSARTEGVGFTIRHTSNWKERVEEVSSRIALAVRTGRAWEATANSLGAAKLVPATLDRLLMSTFKTDSSMVPETFMRIERERDEVREILESPTCEHISGTMYGFVQAVDEWVDHVAPARSDETRFTRSWMRVPPLKHRALQLALAAAER